MRSFLAIMLIARAACARRMWDRVEPAKDSQRQSIASLFLAVRTPTEARSTLNLQEYFGSMRNNALVYAREVPVPLRKVLGASCSWADGVFLREEKREKTQSICTQLTVQEFEQLGTIMTELLSQYERKIDSFVFDLGRICNLFLIGSSGQLGTDLPVSGHFPSRRIAMMALGIALFGRAKAATCAEPSDEATLDAKRAFEAFDQKDLPLAEKLFTKTIDEWRRLDRDVAELTALLVARAGVRTDRKLFAEAKEDLDEAIALMAPTGEITLGGRAPYREYPDAFVQRGLAREGLRDWRGALSDYDKAVALWGGDGDGVNPFALTYRARTRSETGDFQGALDDYRRAADLFARVDRDANMLSNARANEAVTLYGLGRRDEAVKIAKSVLTRTPGFTDLHVMLAADAWNRGDRQKADYEWNFACDAISTSCRKYKDIDWLTEVRRWPPNLIELQKEFLSNRVMSVAAPLPQS